MPWVHVENIFGVCACVGVEEGRRDRLQMSVLMLVISLINI